MLLFVARAEEKSHTPLEKFAPSTTGRGSSLMVKRPQ
jgi:hypothetical protein